jgi:hypothetical protein
MPSGTRVSEGSPNGVTAFKERVFTEGLATVSRGKGEDVFVGVDAVHPKMVL